MSETDTFADGIGVLASDRGSVDDIQEDSPITVNGVAIPENTVLRGGQDIPFFFPPDAAERAAEVLQEQIDAEGEVVHIVKNFHELEGQAPADDIIGEVTSAGYSQGVGVVFRGEITDAETAQKIDLGYLDVSPSVARGLGEELDPTMEARPVTEVTGFRDIAVVGQAQPGASVEVGDSPAVEALSRGFAATVGDVLGDGSDDPEDAPSDDPDESMSLEDAKETLAEEHGIDVDELDDRLASDGDADAGADAGDDRVIELVPPE